MMTSDNYGIDVCIDELDKESPHCPHGPTLLFERYAKGNKIAEKFYACSACRDRKECNFYHKYGLSISEEKKKAREDINRQSQPTLSHEQYYKRFLQIKRLEQHDRKFCRTCGLLLQPKEWAVHASHVLCVNLIEDQLNNPSSLFLPLENKKTNAQYLFSEKMVQFMLNTFENLKYKKVLCIGCPRIHEAIVNKSQQKGFIKGHDGDVEGHDGDIEGHDGDIVDDVQHDKHQLRSLLLDIDFRYQQFYSPKQFCRYNMFNHYFFSGADSYETFREFISGEDSDSLVVVTDPPFGGLVEVLAHTIKKITVLWRQNHPGMEKDLPVMWIFPYFMEQRILDSLSSFTMLDYKVDYTNHDVFQGGSKGRKHGSPVRIFTNISPCLISLPVDEGYRFCQECDRYVAEENKHCKKCNVCTSKDGRQYVHCDPCGRCVKPSRTHCNRCSQCMLPDHTCGQTGQGCYVCGDLSHKRRECPKKTEIFAERKRRKRKAESNDGEMEGTKRKKKPFKKKRRQKKKSKRYPKNIT